MSPPKGKSQEKTNTAQTLKRHAYLGCLTKVFQVGGEIQAGFRFSHGNPKTEMFLNGRTASIKF